MAWESLSSVVETLEQSLGVYDWNAARECCERFVAATVDESAPCPEPIAKRVLDALRRKRRFDLLAMVAEALVVSGQDAARVRRQYGQALIEMGCLLAAEPILRAVASNVVEGHPEGAEARGLLGRIYKQRYVNADRPQSGIGRAHLERALSEYLRVYTRDPARHYWQGINVVALVHRARADGVQLYQAPDAAALAEDILRTLDREPGPAEPWVLATRLEALVSLGRHREAEAVAVDYTGHDGTDAFEAGSTLRQLQEVWRLSDAAPPGSTILPLLRAAVLHGEGGSCTARSTRSASGAPRRDAGVGSAQFDGATQELRRVSQARTRLEATYGSDKIQTLKWYEQGLERSRSVARLERLNGRGHGTAWLVNAADFFPDRTGLLLLTNAHVVNADGSGSAIPPDEAQANFQGLGHVCKVDGLLWSRPPSDLDATFLTLTGLPSTAVGLPLSSRTIRRTTPPPRVNIIGHPDGRDIEFSIYDNALVDVNDRLLHYRTPTEHGSSGSPVFEHLNWEVIGLHHAADALPLSGASSERYEANEGIRISAIQSATKAG